MRRCADRRQSRARSGRKAAIGWVQVQVQVQLQLQVQVQFQLQVQVQA